MMSASHQSAQPVRILIVDDHPIFRAGLMSLIDHIDGVVVGAEAEDEASAINLLESQPFEMMVTDLSLGSDSGLRLIQRARRICPGLRILVASMYDESRYGERAINAGANGYICKQDDPEKLVKAIELVCQGEMFISRALANRMLESRLSGSPANSGDPTQILSERELQVFELIGNGCSTKEIAAKLNVSPKTVDAHRDHIKHKIGLSDNTRLVHRAVEWVLSLQH
jgi:DNA-binding NarL/FixJ family response regulator